MAKDSEVVIDLQGVAKSYREGDSTSTRRILTSLDFTARAGDFVAIGGPSGSGKSTLLNLLAGLDRPDTGTVRVAGEDLAALGGDACTRHRRRYIGLVFQFFNLVPTLTAIENVALPAEYAGRRRTDAMKAAAESLDWVGLADRADHRPTELSGGQQQRVAVARALVTQPDLMLADEPTGNLDSESTNEVLDLLRRFNTERQQTILMVTHDPRVGEACGRIVEMLDGRITNGQAG